MCSNNFQFICIVYCRDVFRFGKRKSCLLDLLWSCTDQYTLYPIMFCSVRFCTGECSLCAKTQSDSLHVFAWLWHDNSFTPMSMLFIVGTIVKSVSEAVEQGTKRNWEESKRRSFLVYLGDQHNVPMAKTWLKPWLYRHQTAHCVGRGEKVSLISG